MNILFLCHFFPPHHTAGAENYTYHLASQLIAQGHRVAVLCVERWVEGERYWNGLADEIYEQIEIRRLNLCWYKAPDPNRYLYNNPITAKVVEEWIAVWKPDVVHLTSAYTLSASVIAECRRAGLPIVVTLVDYWFLCPTLHLLHKDGVLCDGNTSAWDCLNCLLTGTKVARLSERFLPKNMSQGLLQAISQRNWLNRWAGVRGMALDMGERKQYVQTQLRSADMVLSPSHHLAQLHTAIMPGLQITIQAHGHDLAWVNRYQHQPNTQLRIVYIGQISHDKGVHLLIAAFNQLGDCGANARLDIWGEVNEKSRYGEEIKQSAENRPQITLRGRFPRQQLPQVLAQADLVVVPSLWYENSPLVIHEAFAAQIPVVATRLGAMAEWVIDGVNGLLFDYNSADDLCLQLRRVCQTPSLLAHFRSNIPPVKSIETEVTELVTLYTQLEERYTTPHAP